MVETLTESFCERCGTRYEFKAPTRLNPLRKTRGFIGGLKNYLTSQDDMSDAMGDAMRSEEDALASAQLEAFHESFNFCISCRQYTCLNCWNDGEGRCRNCAPVPGTDDLAERLAASYAETTAAQAQPGAEPMLAEADVAGRLGLDAWPTSDMPVAGAATNGHAIEWPAEELAPAESAGAAEENWAQPASGWDDAAPTWTEPEPTWGDPEPASADAESPPEQPIESGWATAEDGRGSDPTWQTPDANPIAAFEAEAEPEPVPFAADLDVEPVVTASTEPGFEPAVAEWTEPDPVVAPADGEVEPVPAVAAVEPEPVVAELEPEPVVAETQPEPMVGDLEPETTTEAADTAPGPSILRVVAWEDDAAYAIESATEAEPASDAALEIAAAIDPEPVDAQRHLEIAEPIVAADASAERMEALAPLDEPSLGVADVEERATASLDTEPEPVFAEAEPVAAEIEPEPVLAEVEAEPEPVVAEAEPEPVAAEVEPVITDQEAAEPTASAEPPATPRPRPLGSLSDTIMRLPVRPTPAPRADDDRVAASDAESPEVAARRAQLDLLGLDDAGAGPVSPDRPAVLPYRSRGATPTPLELAARGGFWEASAREVAGAAANIGVQNCGQCGLSLSASARFCRRCGTRQAQSA